MEEKYNIKNLITFIIIVVAILVVFYGLTILITKKKNAEQKTEKQENTAIIDYDVILASEIYKQKEGSYYVFASKKDDEKLSDYTSKITKYRGKENALKIYEVDLNSSFNKGNVAEENNFEDGNIIFGGTTLLKIENGSIVEAYQGDDINTYLETLNA